MNTFIKNPQREPKPGCRLCHGRGFIGRNPETGKPVPCKCMEERKPKRGLLARLLALATASQQNRKCRPVRGPEHNWRTITQEERARKMGLFPTEHERCNPNGSKSARKARRAAIAARYAAAKRRTAEMRRAA